MGSATYGGNGPGGVGCDCATAGTTADIRATIVSPARDLVIEVIDVDISEDRYGPADLNATVYLIL